MENIIEHVKKLKFESDLIESCKIQLLEQEDIEKIKSFNIDCHLKLKINIEYDLAYDRLYLGPWNEVPVDYRRGFQTLSFIKSFSLIQDKNEKSLDNFLEALHILDLGIIMGSGLEESNRLTECAQYLHNYLVDEYAFETMESKTMPESSSYICDIDILDHPSEEHFWTKYFFLHQPAKLVNCIDLWPAITKWKDLNYLMKIAGYRTVPIELGKKYDNDDWSQGMFRFGEFLKTFMSTQSDTNQIAYLAQHDLFDQIPELRKDFSIPDYCAVGTGETIIKSWIGPANTISTMHTDDKHNLLCQVFGEKLIILASPDQSDNLYPYEGMLSNTCQIDPENLNFTKFPLTKNVKFLKLILKPGEILFIPKLWFHYVKSLSPSISLSFWFEVNETKPGVEQTA